MPTFTKTSPQGKSWTPVMKIEDTNGDKSWNREVSMKVAESEHLNMSRCWRQSPWQVCDKTVCAAVMEFSPLRCSGKVSDKVCGHKSRKSARKSWKSATWFVSQTFMICVRDRGLCCKVGIMEFGLKAAVLIYGHCFMWLPEAVELAWSVFWLDSIISD